MKTRTSIQLLFALCLIALPSLTFAQPGGDFGDPDAMVPIDGGLSLLLAAGVGYGAKKIHEKRKKSKTA